MHTDLMLCTRSDVILFTIHIDNLTLSFLTVQGILKLCHLEELDMSYNRMKIMPDDFGSLNKLKRLDVSNNELVNFPQDRVDILASLEELDVSQNHIDIMPMGFPYLYRLKVKIICYVL